MTPELVTKIKDTYPLAKEYRGGFDFSDGWYDIIIELFDALHNHTLDPEDDPLQFTTFKEKFGTLSIYSYGGDETTYELIRHAEKRSDHTCEECGKPGEMRSGSWIRTLCDEHTKAT